MNARCGGGVCGLVRQVLDDAAGDGWIGVGLNLSGSSEGLDQIGAAGHAYQEREMCNCGRGPFGRLTAAGHGGVGHWSIVFDLGDTTLRRAMG